MKHRTIIAGCIAMFMAVSVQAIPEPNLPPVNIWIHPSAPTTSDNVSIFFSGLWPDTCVPEQIPVAVFAGDSVWIDVLLPGWDDPNECACLSCAPVPTAFEVEGIAGCLAQGQYDVYARVISCEGEGKYESVSGFEVLADKPDDTDCTGCQAFRFRPGSRVVLLTDDPPGGVGLKAGHAGTVICQDCRSGCGRILVSWDLWTGGHKDVDGCAAGTALGFPATSGLWIDLSEVLVGRPFHRAGTIQRGLEGCLVFVADNRLEYNIVATGDMQRILEDVAALGTGGRIRIQGLLNETSPKSDVIRICPQRSGDIYHPIVSACRDLPAPGPGVCDLDLKPGDRVELLVDRPMGAGGGPAVDLYTGAMGTVVCTDSTDDDLPFYVSWDDWTNGTDTDYFCDSIVVPYVSGSGCWMRCNEVRLVHQAGL